MKKTVPASDGKRISILGYRVEQVRFCRGGPRVRLILEHPDQKRQEYNAPIQMNIEGEIKLDGPQGEWVMSMHSKEGFAYEYRQLSPLLELLNAQVEDTEITVSGGINITFSNRWSLFAGVDLHDYPVWYFRNKNISLL